MRTLLFLSIAFMIACSGTRPAAQAPPQPTVHLVGKEAPRVGFDAPGWVEISDETASDQLILVQPGHDDAGIAIWTEDAEPGEAVEQVTTHWMVIILSVPVLFQYTDVTKPEVISEEESVFSISGVGKKGERMVSICRVKLVSGHGTAKWAIVLTYSPEAEAGRMILEAAKAVSSLRIEP